MKTALLPLAPCLLTSAALAGDISLTIEIPRLDVTAWHRPYVAAWIENADKSVTANLTVWYQNDLDNAKGETWLKDLRQWWRKGGRSLKMPVDGVSGPTKPAGTHTVAIPAATLAAAALSEGEYTLVVEAARELGGREMVRVPFKWDGKTALEANAAGTSELGKIGISIQPPASAK